MKNISLLIIFTVNIASQYYLLYFVFIVSLHTVFPDKNCAQLMCTQNISYSRLLLMFELILHVTM